MAMRPLCPLQCLPSGRHGMRELISYRSARIDYLLPPAVPEPPALGRPRLAPPASAAPPPESAVAPELEPEPLFSVRGRRCNPSRANAPGFGFTPVST